MSQPSGGKKNRLGQESSPYLKQHEHNPVDWYPWGDEAIARARAENKPILLSVGYSACHWCHVMAHESFESDEIAAVMNERFINIKVDREERPDLDQIYQNVAQIFTRGGGWPLTVFLTPELKPFFGGTYFPPEDRYGRPGFKRVLTALSDAFHNDSTSVQENATKITEMITSLESVATHENSEKPSWEALEEGARQLLNAVDWVHGGIGSAPKFPNPMTFTFLWRVGRARAIDEAREATLVALTKMASGGIYDQLGGGFSRYAVDHQWAVPHFEKMLYDNGLLLKLYSEVLLTAPSLTQDQRLLYTRVVRETVEYVLREMRSSDGGFYAAQDADSEGEEGKFFVWDPQDLKRALSEEDARIFALRYGVTEAGNFEHEKTVLYLALTPEEVAQRLGLKNEVVQASLERSRKKLFELRSKRIAPGLDNKVLTSWNGLMISGMVWASLALGPETAEGQAAQKAAWDAYEMICTKVAKGSRLMSTFQQGSARFNGYLDDYAYMAKAALDLTRIGRASECAKQAATWIKTVLEHFKDVSGKGYFFTSDDHEKLLQRPKSLSDQAIPSGTSVVLECLKVLAELDPDGMGAQFEKEFHAQIEQLFAEARKSAFGHSELLNAAALALGGVVIVKGPRASELCLEPQVFQGEASEKLLVCYDHTCSLPQADLQAAQTEVRNRLARGSQR